MQLTQAQKDKIIDILGEEMPRVSYGKVILTLNIKNGHVYNVEAHSKRTMNIIQK